MTLNQQISGVSPFKVEEVFEGERSLSKFSPKSVGMSTTVSCPPFSATYPNVVTCGPVTACPGDTIVAGDCNTCTDDTILALVDSSYMQVSYDDNACGSGGCSILTYVVPSGSSCQDYTIQQSCPSTLSDACGGTTTYEVSPVIPSQAPTAAPSDSVVPSENPTSAPSTSTVPTPFATTPSEGTCPYYTINAPGTVPCGPIGACPGDTIVVGDCGSCNGDTYFYLDDGAHNQVSYNDDGCGDGCSIVTYNVPSDVPCQDYTVRQGCYAGFCSGTATFHVTHTPTAFPTQEPDTAPPSIEETAEPSFVAPTSVPTVPTTPSPTEAGVCPPYSTSYPGSVPCGPIEACPGDTITVGDCGTCTGDTYLYLDDGSGSQVAANDDGCGTRCSLIIYYVPPYASCQTYTVRQGCYSGSCTGVTSYTVTPGPTMEPTTAPPTSQPTLPEPTSYPSTTHPMLLPTAAPSEAGVCPPYSTTYPGAVACGPITACPGDTITVGDCGTCTGDTYLYLDDASNMIVSANDDGCGTRCSLITYYVPNNVPCQDYTVSQECYTGSTCTGVTTYTVTPGPTLYPTLPPESAAPTNPEPTSYPSTQHPFVPPTVSPSTQVFTCSSFYYTSSMPNEPVTTCGPIDACAGDTIVAGDCDNCSGQAYFDLRDESGWFVPINTNSCGNGCNQITYFVPAGVACQSYTLDQQCYWYGASCSGTSTYYVMQSFWPTEVPTPGPPTELPSSRPTRAPQPTSYPTTLHPFVPPTVAPTSFVTTCASFSYRSTMPGQPATSCGPIYACPGNTIVVGDCDSCSGQGWLELFDANNMYVAYDTDSCGNGCAQITYRVPPQVDCQDYTLQQQCYNYGTTCSGTSTYYVTQPTPAPTPAPTVEETAPPTYPEPTSFPSTQHPFVPPTVAPTNNEVACPSFSFVSGMPYMPPASCGPIYACPGDLIVAGDCGSCSGMSWFDLFAADGSYVAYDAGSCGGCSQITYSVPAGGVGCQEYTLTQQCYYGGDSCSGTSTYVVQQSLWPTMVPSAGPPMTPQVTCAPFAFDSAIPDEPPVPCGPIAACPGDTIVANDCANTSPNMSMFWLQDPSGAEVGYNAGGCGNGGASITYQVPFGVACQNYTLYQACYYYDDSCSGTSTYQVTLGLWPTNDPTPGPPTEVPTPDPTIAPTYPEPTSFPSTQHPFVPPTVAPTSSAVTCPTFSFVSGMPYMPPASCGPIYACPGDLIVAGDCGSCSGMSWFDLFAADGSYVAYDAGSCGGCSQITYSVPAGGVGCQEYTLTQQCYYGGDSCSGTSTYVVQQSLWPTMVPSAGPPMTPQVTCAPFAFDSAIPDEPPVPCGPIAACPGDTIVANDCANTSPNMSMFWLQNPSGAEVAYNTGGCGNGGASITYQVPFGVACQNYTLYQACYFADDSCSGTSTYQVTLGLWPTNDPTPGPPTEVPTADPTIAPTSPVVTCPSFSYSSATPGEPPTLCGPFFACPGDTMVAGDCDSCSGPQWLNILDSNGNYIQGDGGSCGNGCARITYLIPGGNDCQNYTLQQQCYSFDDTCSGTSTYQVVPGFWPTMVPVPSPPSELPTSHPTRSPQPSFAEPTSFPSTQHPFVPPTVAPTNNEVACPSFSITAGPDYESPIPCGPIYACAGDTIVVGDCGNCDGNSFLTLTYAGGGYVTHDAGSCGGCSQITYTVMPGNACQDYTLLQECNPYGSSCSGTSTYYVTQSLWPTEVPTLGPPTELPSPSPTWAPQPTSYPTTLHPFVPPTPAPSNALVTCPSFSFLGGSTYEPPAQCGPIYACAGDTIMAGDCGSCFGNTFLNLYYANGGYVTHNAGGCGGGCSQFAYTVMPGVICQDYMLVQACNPSDSACSGTTTYVVQQSLWPTVVPTVGPPMTPEVTCAPFSFVDYADTEPPSTCGPISACAGDTIVVSDCSSVSGTSVFQLRDPTGRDVGYDAGSGCGNGGAKITYQVPFGEQCQDYTLWQSCYIGGTCSGTSTYYVLLGLWPTAYPSVAPSVNPQVLSQGIYPEFQATYPAEVTAPDSIYACEGETIAVDNCNSCSGDTYLSLVEIGGTDDVAKDDNGCGPDSLCSNVNYTVPPGNGCQEYEVQQSCNEGTCSGITSYQVFAAVTEFPTSTPTTSFPTNSHSPSELPTSSPWSEPTSQPSVVAGVPTAVRSVPTAEPTAEPTPEPTATQTTLAPSGAVVTAVPSSVDVSVAPSTAVPSVDPTIAVPSIEPTTAAPSTAVPSAVPSTAAPSVEPTTAVPSAEPTTAAPSTAAPSVLPTTAVPSVEPTTAAPSTAVPSAVPSTAAQSVEPTTAAPSTAVPSAVPTTAVPSVEPTTAVPSVLPTTSNPTTPEPSAVPTTAQPSAEQTTAKPSAVPTTMAPSTEVPSAVPTTAVPSVRPTIAPSTTTVPTTAVPSSAKPTTLSTSASPSAKPSTLKPSVAPSTTPTVVIETAYLSLFSSDSCAGGSSGTTVALGQCVQVDNGSFGVFTCASATSDAAWTLEMFSSAACSGASTGTSQGVGACGCDAYVPGNSLMLNCGSGTVPGSCGSHTSSSSSSSSSRMESSEVGGIVGGVLGGVLVVALLGMWLFGWFGFKVVSASASVTPGVVYDGNGTGAAGSAATESGDIEMSVNPIHQSAAAAGAASSAEAGGEVSVVNPIHPTSGTAAAPAGVESGAAAAGTEAGGEAGFVEVDNAAVSAPAPAPM